MTQDNLLEIQKTLAMAFDAIGNLPDDQRLALEKMFQHVFNHSVAMDKKLQHMTGKAVRETIARKDLESVIIRLKQDLADYHRDGVNIARDSMLAQIAERGQTTIESAAEFVQMLIEDTDDPDTLHARKALWAVFNNEREWIKA